MSKLIPSTLHLPFPGHRPKLAMPRHTLFVHVTDSGGSTQQISESVARWMQVTEIFSRRTLREGILSDRMRMHFDTATLTTCSCIAPRLPQLLWQQFRCGEYFDKVTSVGNHEPVRCRFLHQ